MNESVRREECPNTASLALAYLSARRRQPAGPLLLHVVRNVDGQAVDFGSPSEWGPGVAWNVLRGELWVDALQFNADFVDLDAPEELDLPCPISRSVSHPSDLFRRSSLNLSRATAPHMLFPAAAPSLSPENLTLAIHVPPEPVASPSSSLVTPSPTVYPSPSPNLFRPLVRSRTDPLSPPSSKSRSTNAIFALPSPRTKRVCTLLPGLTPADIEFVEALDVGVAAEKGQRSAMEDYYVCVPDFDRIVKAKLRNLEEGMLELPLSRATSSTLTSVPSALSLGPPSSAVASTASSSASVSTSSALSVTNTRATASASSALPFFSSSFLSSSSSSSYVPSAPLCTSAASAAAAAFAAAYAASSPTSSSCLVSSSSSGPSGPSTTSSSLSSGATTATLVPFSSSLINLPSATSGSACTASNSSTSVSTLSTSFLSPSNASGGSSTTPNAGVSPAPSLALATFTEEPRCPPCDAVCLPGFAYFAVFDGHGGQGCAAYCSQSIHKDIAIRYASALASLPNDDILRDAILTGFLDAERVWLGLALNREVGIEKSGSTAAIALFHGSRLYVAHCGDTRVVLSRKGTAIDLTRDHTCKNQAEAERVQRDGGRVVYGAVNGTIEVTRSIGDYEDSGRKTPGLTAVPEVSKFVLTPEDEFIIIACDGLWDVMNSEQAVGYARISLREDNDIQKACADLVQKALHSSEDNVTVLMVGFTKPGSGSSGPFIVDKVCPSFNKKTFLCDRCAHQFEGRNKLEQCPYCAGRKLCGQIECKHCFIRSFASFEDQTKVQCWINGNNDEREALLVSLTSKEKYWFQCNVCTHRFEASINDVTSPSAPVWCPYCAGARCSDSSCSFCASEAKRTSTQAKGTYLPPHLRRLQAKKEAENIASAIVGSIVEDVTI